MEGRDTPEEGRGRGQERMRCGGGSVARQPESTMIKEEAVTNEGGVRGVVGGEAAEVNDDKGGDGDKRGWGRGVHDVAGGEATKVNDEKGGDGNKEGDGGRKCQTVEEDTSQRRRRVEPSHALHVLPKRTITLSVLITFNKETIL